MNRKTGPSGVHYEARVLVTPGEPEVSEWEHLLDMNGSVMGNSFDACMDRARAVVGEQSLDPQSIVIARIETTYITPGDGDLEPEYMQLHRVPEGRRFRVEDEPDVIYTRIEMVDLERNHFNAVSNAGRFVSLDSLQHVILLPP